MNINDFTKEEQEIIYEYITEFNKLKACELEILRVKSLINETIANIEIIKQKDLNLYDKLNSEYNIKDIDRLKAIDTEII